MAYCPTCGGRIFGDGAPGQPSLQEVVTTLTARTGCAVCLPQGVERLCCGQMPASKGPRRRPTDA